MQVIHSCVQYLKLSQTEDAAESLFQYQEVVRIWMGKNRLSFNSSKTEWIWIWRPTRLFHTRFWIGLNTFLLNCFIILKVFLNSQLLLRAGGIFGQAGFCTSSSDVTSVLGYPTDCIVYMGLTLKTTQKMQLVQNIMNSKIMGTLYFIWITPPFWELQKLLGSRCDSRCWWSIYQQYLPI